MTWKLKWTRRNKKGWIDDMNGHCTRLEKHRKQDDVAAHLITFSKEWKNYCDKSAS